MDQGDQSEELISEQTLLDTVYVPGLPQQGVECCAAWRKLPQRVRVAVRRLHRQFGHCPRDVMIKLLRAARVNRSYIEAVRLHRCNTCEDNTNRPRSHKISLPYEYRFNACLGVDLLEVSDAAGARYTVLNMVDMGTTFQQLHVIREGKNATSSQVLKALCDRWIAWAGHPKQLLTDRGLHFRDVLYRYLSGHGVQVHTALLETPEAIGRIDLHGGIVQSNVQEGMC